MNDEPTRRRRLRPPRTRRQPRRRTPQLRHCDRRHLPPMGQPNQRHRRPPREMDPQPRIRRPLPANQPNKDSILHTRFDQYASSAPHRRNRRGARPTPSPLLAQRRTVPRRHGRNRNDVPEPHRRMRPMRIPAVAPSAPPRPRDRPTSRPPRRPPPGPALTTSRSSRPDAHPRPPTTALPGARQSDRDTHPPRALKHAIRTGNASFVDALTDPPAWLNKGATVYEILLEIPRVAQ